jgi:hypothetical protein
MPNWVFNSLAIRKQDKDYVINKNGEVDFNLVCPMPKSLDVTNEAQNPYAIYLYLSLKDGKTVTLEKMQENPLAITLLGKGMIKQIRDDLNDFLAENLMDAAQLYQEGKVLVENYEKYGATDWYDWSCMNWGCKWNAGTVGIEEDGDILNIRFDTPWSPPREYLQALGKKIPFYLEWLEEQGLHGEIFSTEPNVVFSYDLDSEEYIKNEDGDSVLKNENIYTFEDKKNNVIKWGENFDIVR